MALYEPIRDSFSEFNRMLQDAQTWNERHAAAEADKQYKHSVLQSNLTQRAFENEMTMKNHDLRVRAGDLAANREQARLAQQKLDYALAVKNSNQDATKIANAEKIAKLRREKLKLENDALRVDTTPVDTSLRGAIPEHLIQNPEAMSDLNSITGEMFGAAIDENLDVFTVNMEAPEGVDPKEVLQLSPAQKREFQPILAGWLAEYDSPAENARVNVEKLRAGQSDLRGLINKDSTLPKDKAFARRELNRINAEIAKNEAVYDPANAKQLYGQRARDAFAAAEYLHSIKMTDSAKAKEKAAQKLLEKAFAANDVESGRFTPLYHEELTKDGKVRHFADSNFSTKTGKYSYAPPGAEEGEMVESTQLPDGVTSFKPTALKADASAVSAAATRQDKAFNKGFEQLRKDYSPSGNILPVTPDVNKGAVYAENLYTKRATDPMLNKKGDVIRENGMPRNAAEGQALRRWAQKTHKKNHNKAYKTLVQLQSGFLPDGTKLTRQQKAERIERWREAANAHFDYLPVKPYNKQIYNARTEVPGEKKRNSRFWRRD